MPQARYLTYNDRAYRREKAIAEYQRGAGFREVAAKYGLSYNYVRHIMRQAGVTRVTGWRRRHLP